MGLERQGDQLPRAHEVGDSWQEAARESLLHSAEINRGDPENDLKQLSSCCEAKEGRRLSRRQEVTPPLVSL